MKIKIKIVSIAFLFLVLCGLVVFIFLAGTSKKEPLVAAGALVYTGPGSIKHDPLLEDYGADGIVGIRTESLGRGMVRNIDTGEVYQQICSSTTE